MVQTAARRKVKSTKSKQKHKIAIVVSLFNEKICRNLLTGSLETLKEQGFAQEQLRVFEVAGAYEIPFLVKKIALTNKYSGIVALGCVIRGDTPHFEFVSLAATMGCQQAQLDTGVPVGFGIITVNNERQAVERSELNEFNKGREASLALLDSLDVLETI